MTFLLYVNNPELKTQTKKYGNTFPDDELQLQQSKYIYFQRLYSRKYNIDIITNLCVYATSVCIKFIIDFSF